MTATAAKVTELQKCLLVGKIYASSLSMIAYFTKFGKGAQEIEIKQVKLVKLFLVLVPRQPKELRLPGRRRSC